MKTARGRNKNSVAQKGGMLHTAGTHRSVEDISMINGMSMEKPALDLVRYIEAIWSA